MGPKKHIFLITGASSGLGLAIALEALHDGHEVVGTARNVSKAAREHPEFTEAGGFWMQLDLTAADAQPAVKKAIGEYDVDILVNNAGNGIYGTLEDMRSVVPYNRYLKELKRLTISCE
jgi:NAD(P)-dependent dehydrogenase (short-subunit alcohol dehydrogenase family)